MPVRTVITRSKKTFRVKFPSRKCKRMVMCESILERDTARWLEISPYARYFVEQPRTIIYYDDSGEQHEYTPDFEVHLPSDAKIDLEVKPFAALSRPDIRAKFSRIAKRYQELGQRFRIVTDRDVRVEPLHSSLQKLVYHSRPPLIGTTLDKLESQLVHGQFKTVAEAAGVVGHIKHVYRLVASGFLAIDFGKPLCANSPVWLRQPGEQNDPFRL